MVRVKYPKFSLFLLMVVLAYVLFQGKTFPPLNSFLLSSGYLGIFVSGILYAYGFTVPFATAFFLILSSEVYVFPAALLASFSAMIGNLIVFKFIRNQFQDEIRKLSTEKIIVWISSKIPRGNSYLLPILGCLIIALPLPDEIGIAMLAASRKIPTKVFIVLSYVLNVAGISAILLIGRTI
jgi:hypothetical protein